MCLWVQFDLGNNINNEEIEGVELVGLPAEKSSNEGNLSAIVLYRPKLRYVKSPSVRRSAVWMMVAREMRKVKSCSFSKAIVESLLCCPYLLKVRTRPTFACFRLSLSERLKHDNKTRRIDAVSS